MGELVGGERKWNCAGLDGGTRVCVGESSSSVFNRRGSKEGWRPSELNGAGGKNRGSPTKSRVTWVGCVGELVRGEINGIVQGWIVLMCVSDSIAAGKRLEEGLASF